jgi:hypothetical protein
MKKFKLWPEQRTAYRLARAFGFKGARTPEQMEQTINDARLVLEEAMILGAVAAGYHGWRRITRDVDVLYCADDAGILSRLHTDFRIVIKSSKGWHQFEHRETGVGLKLIPEGGRGMKGTFPDPRTAGGRDGIISLSGLAWVSLVGGFSIDTANLVEVAKTRLAEMRAVTDRLPPELQPRFREVLAQAQKELDYDPHNNRDHGIPGVKESPAPYGKKRKVKPAAKRRAAAAR